MNTRAGARRAIEFAFNYAAKNGRKKVTIVHKANVLKALTGLFLDTGREVAKKYESIASCPDELLLFMHHVPYSYKLHSGKTVIQFIYDSHYEGAETVANWARQWKARRAAG